MDTSTEFPHLEEAIEATTRYLASIELLGEEDLRAPSILPGWTRAHVITHLSRNADGLANLLHSAQQGRLIPMYASQASRNADIEAGAARSLTELLEDAAASAGRWLQAANELHAAKLEELVYRTPGADPWPVRQVASMRRTEVEIHHADLLIGYSARDWPEDFTDHLIARRSRELGERGIGLTLRADDGVGVWTNGAGPEVSGPAAELAWWLIGRGRGVGLTCSAGDLPEIGDWV